MLDVAALQSGRIEVRNTEACAYKRSWNEEAQRVVYEMCPRDARGHLCTEQLEGCEALIWIEIQFEMIDDQTAEAVYQAFEKE